MALLDVETWMGPRKRCSVCGRTMANGDIRMCPCIGSCEPIDSTIVWFSLTVGAAIFPIREWVSEQVGG